MCVSYSLVCQFVILVNNFILAAVQIGDSQSKVFKGGCIFIFEVISW